MELDKRVTGIETELKIIKGEVRELLVDIRDRMNRTDNPFCRIQSQRAPEFDASKKETPVEVEKPEEKIQDEKTQVHQGHPEKTEANSDSINPDSIQPPRETVKPEGTKQEIIQEFADSAGKEIDTLMLVELMRWVDYAVRTVGHSNLDELLNLYNATGHLSDKLREVLQNIANLSTEEPAEASRVSMKDNIMVLSHLSAILNPGKSGGKIQPIYGETGWKGEKKDKKTELAFN